MTHARHPYNSCLCLASRRLTRVITQIYDRALAPSGLGTPQFSVLGAVYTAREDGISLSRLSATLDMDISTASRAIRPLIRDGFVRQVTGSDRREKKCVITPSGQAKWKETLPLWQQAQTMASAHVPPETYATLSTLKEAIAPLA